MPRVFFSTPEQTGKTRLKEQLAQHFGCSMIVDDWKETPDSDDRLGFGHENTLILSNSPIPHNLPAGTRIVQGEVAMTLLRNLEAAQ